MILLLVDQCLETSRGTIEGDRIVVTGSLLKRESLIKRINRHRREAIIGLGLSGGMRQIKIGLEIVGKVP